MCSFVTQYMFQEYAIFIEAFWNKTENNTESAATVLKSESKLEIEMRTVKL
jgi:hypothetical protein